MAKLAIAFVAGAVALPLTFILVAMLGFAPADSRSEPPGWEAAIGRHALGASLSQRAAHLTNPIAANDEAALLAGMRLYRQNCVGCHGGVRGKSDWGSANFYPRVPQFWQEPVALTPGQAYVAIKEGVRYSGMGAWEGNLSDEEMWQAANFISRMHDLPPAVDQAWRNPPQRAPAQ